MKNWVSICHFINEKNLIQVDFLKGNNLCLVFLKKQTNWWKVLKFIHGFWYQSPHLIQPKEDEGPTPKDVTNTHWHCKQHSRILHEKHLGTDFAFAITHVETFLQWLLVTKKQKWVGMGLVQLTGLDNIVCNHRKHRDQPYSQRRFTRTAAEDMAWR